MQSSCQLTIKYIKHAKWLTTSGFLLLHLSIATNIVFEGTKLDVRHQVDGLPIFLNGLEELAILFMFNSFQEKSSRLKFKSWGKWAHRVYVFNFKLLRCLPWLRPESRRGKILNSSRSTANLTRLLHVSIFDESFPIHPGLMSNIKKRSFISKI